MKPTLHMTDILSISPILTLLIFSLLLLLLETFFPKKTRSFAYWLTILGLGISLACTYISPGSQNPLLTYWVKFDPLSQFFSQFFCLIGIAVAVISAAFFRKFPSSEGEHYFFLFSAVFGLTLMSISADFLTLFIGIETLSLTLYVWCAYKKEWSFSKESGVKYFLMGALSTAYLLYGIALIYGALGTTQLDQMGENYHQLVETEKHLFLGGIALVTLALAFEAAVVPFHFWAPDTYAGASTPVTAFMAVGTKAGAFAALIRLFPQSLGLFHPLWNGAMGFLAILTLFYANFVAIRQTQLRRFFAYSGISQAGYLWMGLVVGTPEALSALLYYLIVYTTATLCCFIGVVLIDKGDKDPLISEFAGLYKRAPVLCGLLTFALLTLAGIPPTAGFLGKFALLLQTYESGYTELAFFGVAMSVFSAYYYLGIVRTLYRTNDLIDESGQDQQRGLQLLGIAGTVILLIFLICPGQIEEYLGRVIGS